MAALESSRSRQLRKLSDSLPGADKKTMAGLSAARDTALQEQIAGAPKTAGPAQAQQIGSQQAQVAGKQALAVGAKAQQQQQQIGQVGLEQAGVESQARIGEATRGVSKQERGFANRLNRLSEDSKMELLDEQMVFRTDEAGRAMMNERQMADWAMANARSNEEYQDYIQTIGQMHGRKIQLLEAASQKLVSPASGSIAAAALGLVIIGRSFPAINLSGLVSRGSLNDTLGETCWRRLSLLASSRGGGFFPLSLFLTGSFSAIIITY